MRCFFPKTLWVFLSSLETVRDLTWLESWCSRQETAEAGRGQVKLELRVRAGTLSCGTSSEEHLAIAFRWVTVDRQWTLS